MPLSAVTDNNLPIGIDLGTARVKLAQLRQTADGLELLAACALDIPSTARGTFDERMDYVGQNLQQIIKANGFKGRQCVMSLPANETFVHHVRIPKMPDKDIPFALESELQTKLPFPVDQAIIRHLVAGEFFADAGEAKQEIIAVATAKTTVDTLLAMAKKTKLDVVGVNVEPCAISDCFARLFNRPVAQPTTTIYVDMGSTSTQVVLAHDSKIVFARNLTMGADWLDDAIASQLGISLDEAKATRRERASQDRTPGEHEDVYLLLEGRITELAKELTQCLRYHESVFRNRCADRVIFLGGQAYDKRFCQMIAQKLNLPAQIGDPLVQIDRVVTSGMAIAQGENDPMPDWAVAVGLSIGAQQAA